MSRKLNWAINIILLALIIDILFSPKENHVFDVVFVLATAAYFVVQVVRHRGGNEISRFQWSLGPRWWRRFASDDFEEPGKKEPDPPSSSPKQ